MHAAVTNLINRANYAADLAEEFVGTEDGPGLLADARHAAHQANVAADYYLGVKTPEWTEAMHLLGEVDATIMSVSLNS